MTIELEQGVFVEWYPWSHPGGSPVGQHIRSEYERFKPLIGKGRCVVDIGAHIGDTTIPMGALVGPQGKVFAFEPNPFAFKALKLNVDANTTAMNIECHNVAIMPEDGDFVFHYSDPQFCNGGYAYGLQTPVGCGSVQHVHPLPVTGRRLEHFIGNTKVDFIKVDTEGFDHHILRSIQEIIRRDKPTIMAEVFTDLTESERVDFLSVVRDMGYKLGPPWKQREATISDFTANLSAAYDVILSP